MHNYLDKLRQALAGLPPELIAKTMAYYEQSFNEGLAAGRSEQEIADELGAPKKIAMTLRANTRRRVLAQQHTPVKLLRLLASLIGLAIFNLFMVVPAAVYAALLAALYALGLSCYLAGIAITASGLSGANELMLDGPLRPILIRNDGDAPRETRIVIGDTGMRVHRSLAGGGIRISTDMERDARTTQTVIGMAIVVGGIILFLLSLVVTRYTLIGIRRYIAMNISLLKGN